MKKLIFALCVLMPALISSQGEVPKKTYSTAPLGSHNIAIDGILDDAGWDLVEWTGDFTVQHPNNGEEPKRQTQFKVLYDSDNIYVGFRCFHEDPSKIENRLSRRDNFPGDWIEIHFDSYYDKSTAFSFTTSVSGVKGDEFISGNGNNWDSNWNPIWYTKTSIDDEGWTAEVRIPMSQLRFGDKEQHVWGMNVMRRDFEADERSTWQHIPVNASGWVSNYGELNGILGIKPKKQVEIQPFVVAKVETGPEEAGNPFETGSSSNINIGLDGKIGITSDITLDFTINPDFGQVEADPSALNLDGFQIFFDERRPFFVENANLFGFGISRLEAGGPFWNDNLFYSRRIGASPRGSISTPDGSFVDRPDFTTILGAAKVSGKTQDGWSISLLESITREEHAEIDLNGSRSTMPVEPLTNFFLGGLSKDLKQGESRIGGTFTAVSRDLNGTGLENQFHNQAISGGVDLFHSWKNREWQLKGNFIFSRVSGTSEKIEDTQTSFEHYFQRPDAEHVEVDNSKTSLGGHGGTFSLANYGGSDNISFQTGVTWRSPGLELNDIGFLNTADQIDYVTWAGYRSPNPVSIFRQFRVNVNHYSRWTYGGEHLYQAFNTNLHGSFTNYWNAGFGFTYEQKDISTKALFGGPKLRQSAGLANFMYIESDNRKKVNFGFSMFGFVATGKDKGAVRVQNYSVGVSYQPSNALRLSIRPRYFKQNRVIQNVSLESFEGINRYVTGTVEQKTFSTSIRANYNLTPDLTIQYWGQPFVSIGNYSDFKYITDPLASVYTDRFHPYDPLQISNDEDGSVYYIDENRDGRNDYSFSNPDFNFLQFRSNLVLRWEYKPGSELFLVWTQSTTNSGDPSKGIFPSLDEDLFGSDANNTFLLKATYRFY